MSDAEDQARLVVAKLQGDETLMTDAAARALAEMGLPTGDLHSLPTSDKRFADGAHYRIEIPSVEGPQALTAVLEQGDRLDVPVHRVSQGSGVFMTTDTELDAFVDLAASVPVELSMFARPNAGWVASAMAQTDAGGVLAPVARGQDQVRDVVADIERAAAHGVRSVLVADIGVLSIFSKLRADGALPADMQCKVSVMLPAANPASARVLERMGADTLNVPTDLSLPQLAAIRAAVDIPLDVYIEAPSNLGGYIHMHQIPDLIRVAAPVYLKFGIRNGPDVYPSGQHLTSLVLDLSRERVRRARLGLELLARSDAKFETSKLGALGLALPVSSVGASVPTAADRAAPSQG